MAAVVCVNCTKTVGFETRGTSPVGSRAWAPCGRAVRPSPNVLFNATDRRQHVWTGRKGVTPVW